ncbi:nuclear transport factor 2 family protein [Halomonas sp. EGI 63088]|uniref:Nuclear transport factor 2 family protein n=1 Tax=Halomonas flagellata TaxID=2920385 RepID=A0ABS9RR78_9GAMM|nr:nuclear transport factor 2 family protein [Halomonas flagellata]MCH4562304.1 nuclear transport factor 2 family protein [Halomonas flagellata]
MTTHTGLPAEAAVLEQLESWTAAVRDRDIDAIVAHYAPHIVAFDAVAQLQFKGVEAYRQHWQACLELCPGLMDFELHEVVLHADGEVAFCHALHHCGDTNDKGEPQVGWLRMTSGYRRIEGEWKVVHEHFSAPFEMESGKALFDLEP